MMNVASQRVPHDPSKRTDDHPPPLQYSRAVLLSRYKHFVSPTGLEAHAAVHSPRCILPELFSSTGGANRAATVVAAVPTRIKRTISELNEKPKGPRLGGMTILESTNAGPPLQRGHPDTEIGLNPDNGGGGGGGYTTEMWSRMEERVKEAAFTRQAAVPPPAGNISDFQSLLQRAAEGTELTTTTCYAYPPAAQPSPPILPTEEVSPIDRIVRWTDGRPLFYAQNRVQADALTCQLSSVNSEASEGNSSVLREQYETSVYILYSDLASRGVLRFPPIIESELLRGDPFLSPPPDLRQLLWETNSLLVKLGQWERSLMCLPPPSPQLITAPDDLEWEYLDPSNKVQGPFTNLKMREWYIREFFPPDLPVRRAVRDGSTPAFISLRELYSQRNSPSRGGQGCVVPFFHLPPSWTSPPGLSPSPPPPAAPPFTANNAAYPLLHAPQPPIYQPEPAVYLPSPRTTAAVVPERGKKSSPPNLKPGMSAPAAPGQQARSVPLDRPTGPSATAEVASSPLRTLPLSWVSRRSDSGGSTNPISVPDLGPSIQESRVVNSPPPAAATAAPAVADPTPSSTAPRSKAAAKKAKGKKQALGDLLIEQSAEPAAKWAWGNRPANPWNAQNPIPNAIPGAPSTAATAQVSYSPESAPRCPSPAAQVAPTPPPQVTTSSPTASSLVVIGEGKLDPDLREDVMFLCSRYSIALDEDFIDLLAGLQSRDAMAMVLNDNLGSRSSAQIDGFVDDLWELVKNPFKPVKKGIAGPPPAAAATKKGKKAKGGRVNHTK